MLELEGPLTLNDLKNRLGVTSPNLLHRLKELEERYLIRRDGNKYVLTPSGLIIVNKLRPPIRLLQLIENQGQFLNEHDPSPIPGYLLDRIDELGKCELVSNNADEMNAIGKIFVRLYETRSIHGITSAFSYKHPEAFLSIARRGIPVSTIFSDRVLERLETEYPDTLRALLAYDNVSMYSISEEGIGLMVSDSFTSIFLRRCSGTIETQCTLDTQCCLVSFEESAKKWGMELFEYYRQKSRKITSQQ